MLEALQREGGVLGGEQSGHVICLDGHVTGDGLAAALLLCERARGRHARGGGGGDAALSRRRRRTSPSSQGARRPFVRRGRAAERELGGRGRVLVRPSGTEPVIRVLAEAERAEEAEALCGSVADSFDGRARLTA